MELRGKVVTADAMHTQNVVLLSTDGGTSWSHATTVPQPGGGQGQSLFGASCPSTSGRVAVGYDNTDSEVLVSPALLAVTTTSLCRSRGNAPTTRL